MIVIEYREAGTTGEYYYGITHNCSKDGFIFESETFDLLSGTVLDLKLKHPDRDETINCLGDVAWTKKQKYGFIAKVILHSVPTEKQSILDEIISLSPPSDGAVRKELRPTPSPSAEDRGTAQIEGYSDIITESIVAAVRKNNPEETGREEERDISEAVPIEEKIDKVGSASKVKNKPGKLSPALITVLIVLASAILVSYLIHENSTEKLEEMSSSMLMSRDTVPGVQPEYRADEIPLNEIKEPATAQIEESLIITETQNTFLDTVPVAADGDGPPRSAPNETGEEKVDPTPDSLGKSDKNETGIAVIIKQIDPDPGFKQDVTDLIPDVNSLSESLNKGPETGETIAGERFIVHVSAWKTKEYAVYINKRVMSFYPDAFILFENNHHIVMVPNIASHEEAFSISEELADRFDVSPLIYVQHRNIVEIRKTEY